MTKLTSRLRRHRGAAAGRALPLRAGLLGHEEGLALSLSLSLTLSLTLTRSTRAPRGRWASTPWRSRPCPPRRTRGTTCKGSTCSRRERPSPVPSGSMLSESFVKILFYTPRSCRHHGARSSVRNFREKVGPEACPLCHLGLETSDGRLCAGLVSNLV